MSDKEHLFHNPQQLQGSIYDASDRIFRHMTNGTVRSPDFTYQNKLKKLMETARDLHQNHPNAEQRTSRLQPLVHQYNDLVQNNPADHYNKEGIPMNRAKEGGLLDSRLNLHEVPVVIPGNYSYITNR